MSSSSLEYYLRRLQAISRLAEHWLVLTARPQLMAHLPVWFLCWCHCRKLDGKILRLRSIGDTLELWQVAIRAHAADARRSAELLDVDHALQNNVSSTRDELCLLRAEWLDVERRFDQLGHRSERLRQRQTLLMQLLERCCVAASAVLVALVEHEAAALAQLQAHCVSAASLSRP